MTTYLKFDLSDPDDERALRKCLDGEKAHSVLWEFDQWLRNEIKYNDITEFTAGLELARKKLHEFLTESNITIDD